MGSSSPLHFLLPLLLICSSPLPQPTSASFPVHLNFPIAGEDGQPATRHRRTKIFHPSTGLCVVRGSITEPLSLGPCSKSTSWKYTPQQFLMVTGTYFCLEPVAVREPVKLVIVCDSPWTFASEPEGTTHLTTELGNGGKVCLDADDDGTLVTNSCNQSGGDRAAKQGGDSQWFKLISTSDNS